MIIESKEWRKKMLSVRFFEELSKSGVPYCHFKSNEHLLAGLNGKTDLDVLIDRESTCEVQKILIRLNLKRFEPHAFRQVPSVEDWLGYDSESGRLIHIHLHFRIITGPKHLKPLRVPWEDKILNTRVRDESTQVYITRPDAELALLLVRLAVKLRTRDGFRNIFRKDPLEESARQEFEWLKAKVSPEQLKTWLYLTFDKKTAQVGIMLYGNFGLSTLKKFRKLVLRQLKPYQRSGLIGGKLQRWFREGYAFASKLNRKLNLRPVPMRRGCLNGGLTVAIIGSDGSGKSTVCKALKDWVNWKVDVYSVYLGSGAGQSSLARMPMNFVRDRMNKKKKKDNSEFHPARIGPFKFVFAIVLAREKRNKLKRMTRARENGMVVICDRLPQTQIGGVNDGPLLHEWRVSGNLFFRKISNWEQKIYQGFEEYPPDLVLRLNVDPKVAASRRPGMDLSYIENRVSLVKGLSFLGSNCVEIDANCEVQSVIRSVKAAVWEKL